MEKDYNVDNIRVISALEAVRLRPKIYFEPCFKEETLDLLVFESLCHAFDEYFDGNCTTIDLNIWNDSFTVRYDAGMPLSEPAHDGKLFPEVIMTVLFACSNQKKHLAVGEEFCQIGMSQINFGSESIRLTTLSDGLKGTFLFKNGEMESSEVEEHESTKSWTEIHITPSKELFGNFEFSSKGVKNKMQELEPKLAGLKFNLVSHIKD